ncbi:related to MFS monosaccharide transporter [Phialocephala subalpina]|uniref:Related to MFS monosaccharide transporter n=1 Tax=Phialocephala subalpina TaxID=576137 RepID=A0A1L7XFD0_9HELO|nr:related to MFS monosaccharide transporter [Phialocephala subalpina]
MASAVSYFKSEWRAILICCFICIGAFQFGYDTSYFSGILAMPKFLKDYGSLDPTTGTYIVSAGKQSLVTSIINAGEFLGAVSSYYIGSKIGRKGGLYVSSVCVVLGVIFQVSAPHEGLLIAGRLVLGYAVGLISCFIPLYVADCAPSRVRGALVSMYQYVIGLGLILGVIVDNSTKNRSDTGSFRIPMAVQLIFPIILVSGLVLFAPESPRWLIEKSQTAKAEKSLRRLHGNDSEKIQHEVEMIHQTIETYNDGRESSWKNVFTWGPEGRKAYLGFALQAFQQASGINFITGYGIVFFIAIGIDNPFIIQLGLYLVAMPAIWISQYTIERFGRRPVMLVSGGLMAATSIVMGACGLAKEKTHALDQTIVAMVYIFLVVFNLGWGPTVWVLTSEISTGKNRGKLMSFSTGTNWLFTWLVSFTFPYLFNSDAADLGAKVGFIYGSLMVAACIWTYFLLPETAGRSLEELHLMFEMGLPARKFKSYIFPEIPVDMAKKDLAIVQVEETSV